MELFFATTYDRNNDTQVLLGAYATREIAYRELFSILTNYENKVDDEIVGELMTSGEIEGFDHIIRFRKQEVEGTPKKVCLLAGYYVSDDQLSACRLFTSLHELTRICKQAVIDGELADDLFIETRAEYSKAVTAATKEMTTQLRSGQSYYYDPSSGDPENFVLSNWVKVKMK